MHGRLGGGVKVGRQIAFTVSLISAGGSIL